MSNDNENNNSIEGTQLQHIGEIEKRLWSVADYFRVNSNFASNEYFMPVMGMIFLRHAYGRFLKVKAEIEETLPTRGGKRREPTKEDFSGRGSIYLRPEAQFDHLVAIPDGGNRAQALVDAMESIEKDYESLRGALPKSEYQDLGDEDLGQLLCTFNDPALNKADGDVVGRIYEYFLTQFGGRKPRTILSVFSSRTNEIRFLEMLTALPERVRQYFLAQSIEVFGQTFRRTGLSIEMYRELWKRSSLPPIRVQKHV